MGEETATLDDAPELPLGSDILADAFRGLDPLTTPDDAFFRRMGDDPFALRIADALANGRVIRNRGPLPTDDEVFGVAKWIVETYRNMAVLLLMLNDRCAIDLIGDRVVPYLYETDRPSGPTE